MCIRDRYETMSQADLFMLWQEAFGQISKDAVCNTLFQTRIYTRWSAASILAVLNTHAVTLLLMVIRDERQ